MKKKILVLVFGFFMFTNASYAATCTTAYNDTQSILINNYNNTFMNCGSDSAGLSNCTQQALFTYQQSSNVNTLLWAACCYLVPWNC